jgi:hypothetical protein
VCIHAFISHIVIPPLFLQYINIMIYLATFLLDNESQIIRCLVSKELQRMLKDEFMS